MIRVMMKKENEKSWMPRPTRVKILPSSALVFEAAIPPPLI
jgi:hypothetical protein